MYQRSIKITIPIIIISFLFLFSYFILDINAINKSEFNVKIIYPNKNNIYKISDILTINGTSNYGLHSDCSVFIIINHHKPYLKVLPKGSNGSNDFSYWEFNVDKKNKIGDLIVGANTITAKNNCLKTGLSTFFSTTFNLTDEKNSISNVKYNKIDNSYSSGLHGNSNSNDNYIIKPSNALCCKNGTQSDNNFNFKNETSTNKKSDENHFINKDNLSKDSSDNFVDLFKYNLNKLSSDKQFHNKHSKPSKDYIVNDDLAQNKPDNLQNIQNVIEKIIS